jgi:hypothetical protein
MNKEMYQELKAQIPNFDALYVRDVDPNSLIFDPYNSQIRAKGHVTKNVPPMASVIQQRGLSTAHLPPVTVRPTGGADELKEGATRALASIKAGAPTIRVSDYHYQLFGNDSWKWKKFQARGNNHDELSQSNTDDDIRSFIKDSFDSGHLANELGLTYRTDPAKFIADGAKWIKINIYDNHPRTTQFMRSALETAATSTVSNLYVNYTDSTALDHFRKYSGTGCTSTAVGPDAATNNIIVRLVKTVSRVKPNLSGYALFDDDDYPHLKTHVVFWHDSLSTITDAKLQQYRLEMTNLYDQLNTKLNNLGGLWVLPQIRGGRNKENPLSIKKVR